ncbi:MAG: hypothetical protein L6R37_002318 [Teloschistes peruensis]|nr:MAG: hypothetical protein L6R37_002318 [Teloschistes peruensis]
MSLRKEEHYKGQPVLRDGESRVWCVRCVKALAKNPFHVCAWLAGRMLKCDHCSRIRHDCFRDDAMGKDYTLQFQIRNACRHPPMAHLDVDRTALSCEFESSGIRAINGSSDQASIGVTSSTAASPTSSSHYEDECIRSDQASTRDRPDSQAGSGIEVIDLASDQESIGATSSAAASPTSSSCSPGEGLTARQRFRRRIEAIEIRMALCHRREAQRHGRPKATIKQEESDGAVNNSYRDTKDEFPIICRPTQRST